MRRNGPLALIFHTVFVIGHAYLAHNATAVRV